MRRTPPPLRARSIRVLSLSLPRPLLLRTRPPRGQYAVLPLLHGLTYNFIFLIKCRVRTYSELPKQKSPTDQARSTGLFVCVNSLFIYAAYLTTSSSASTSRIESIISSISFITGSDSKISPHDSQIRAGVSLTTKILCVSSRNGRSARSSFICSPPHL